MTKPLPLVCTVLPTFNERDNIALLINGVLENAITPHLVLVVDDNSPDGTGDVVAALSAEWKEKERRREDEHRYLNLQSPISRHPYQTSRRKRTYVGDSTRH